MLWLTQRRMAELFNVKINTINYHVKEIFKTGELDKNSTIRKIRIVEKEGQRNVSRIVDFYNLDLIIAVGCRVNSYQATQFRIWVTKTLREFVIKGFVLDEKEMHNPLDKRGIEGNVKISLDRFEQEMKEFYYRHPVSKDEIKKFTAELFGIIE